MGLHGDAVENIRKRKAVSVILCVIMLIGCTFMVSADTPVCGGNHKFYTIKELGMEAVSEVNSLYSISVSFSINALGGKISEMGENPGWTTEEFLDCGDREEAYGEKLVYKGYPSEDGAPCYFYSGTGISILSRSTCKEGAYAFWEYYLLHHYLTADAYYTNKKLLENSMTYASEIQYAYDEQRKKMIRYQADSSPESDEKVLQWFPYMSEEQCDKQLVMMETVRIDTLENQTLRNIILEEAQYYFQGIRELEETCEIIQSRVQLYLAETK